MFQSKNPKNQARYNKKLTGFVRYFENYFKCAKIFFAIALVYIKNDHNALYCKQSTKYCVNVKPITERKILTRKKATYPNQNSQTIMCFVFVFNGVYPGVISRIVLAY